MAKQMTDYRTVLERTVRVMGEMGLLLAAQDVDGKPNAMAIGWGTPGIIWGKPHRGHGRLHRQRPHARNERGRLPLWQRLRP